MVGENITVVSHCPRHEARRTPTMYACQFRFVSVYNFKNRQFRPDPSVTATGFWLLYPFRSTDPAYCAALIIIFSPGLLARTFCECDCVFSTRELRNGGAVFGKNFPDAPQTYRTRYTVPARSIGFITKRECMYTVQHWTRKRCIKFFFTQP